jgi:glycosyltransferase involved in cell wall biosynthesis
VHLYCAEPVAVEDPVQLHALGVPDGDDLVAQAHEFARRVRTAVARDVGAPVSALAYEWGTIPALLALGEGPRVLCLETLERQRSDDMSRPFSAAVEEIERSGLAAVQHAIVRSGETAEHAGRLLPGCADRLVHSRWVFPSHEFAPVPDPGEVKARYHVGPVDPTILFVGDLDWRHGPDLLIKALPPVLKNNPQVRLIIAGEGEMLWPLKVQSRYMLLDHAVRIVGDVSGQPVRELVAAADLVAVPSRECTEDWQILAGWAAERPVVATHEVAGHFCVHEEDCVLVYSNQGSCVWGIERLLYDPALARRIGMRGRQRLEQLHGWGGVAAQIEELLFLSQTESAQL